MNYIPDTTIAEMFWTGESRLNRLRYLKRSLVLLVFFTIINMILKAWFGISLEADGNVNGFDFGFFDNLFWESPTAYLVLVFASDAILALFSYKLDVRRLKDLGKDNKLAIVVLVCFLCGNFIPFVGIISAAISIYILLAKGDEGDNIYGPDPLEGKR